MDTQPTVVETQTTTPPMPATPDPKPKGNGALVALTVILGLIIVGLLVYIAYEKGMVEIPFLRAKSDSQENAQNEENGDDTTVVETEESSVEFEGDVISATLPEGWSIEEYFNGEGTDTLVEGVTYSGLTGLKIFNEDDEEMFWLKAVNGIGFAGCNEYYAFEDESPDYRQEMEDMADEMGDTLNINDFSSMPYTEFEWLGHTTRRVAYRFFQDDEEGNEYFEAPCFNIVVTLDGVTFEDADSDGPAYEAYFYAFPEDISGDELVQIDGVLESMELAE